MLTTVLIALTRGSSSLSTTQASNFRPNAPKPAKPLGLNQTASMVYPRKGHCQSHLAYLAYFQHFNLKKRPLFSKRVHERSENCCLSCKQAAPIHRQAGHAPCCARGRIGRDTQKRMQAPKAGMFYAISDIRGTPGEHAKNAHTPEARIFHAINDIGPKMRENTRKKTSTTENWNVQSAQYIGQKRGLDTNPECALESVKAGLHEMCERGRFLLKDARNR